MAKYDKKSSKKVAKTIEEMKKGKLTIGKSNQKVKSRKQAIAIGLDEARRDGSSAPRKSNS